MASKQGPTPGCFWMAVIGGLILIGAIVNGIHAAYVGLVVDHAPSAVVMPDLTGKDCGQATRIVRALVSKHRGVTLDGRTNHGSINPNCSGAIVVGTDPSAGTRIALHDDQVVHVQWWNVGPGAYAWYRAHPTMPDIVGKVGLSGVPPSIVHLAVDRHLVNTLVDNKGWYDSAGNKVLSTDPAPGQPLTIGRVITVKARAQRGAWHALPSGSGGDGSTGGSGGWHWHGPHVGVCGHLGPVHVCS